MKGVRLCDYRIGNVKVIIYSFFLLSSYDCITHFVKNKQALNKTKIIISVSFHLIRKQTVSNLNFKIRITRRYIHVNNTGNFIKDTTEMKFILYKICIDQ